MMRRRFEEAALSLHLEKDPVREIRPLRRLRGA
jgi:hypothetical protein